MFEVHTIIFVAVIIIDAERQTTRNESCAWEWRLRCIMHARPASHEMSLELYWGSGAARPTKSKAARGPHTSRKMLTHVTDMLESRTHEQRPLGRMHSNTPRMCVSPARHDMTSDRLAGGCHAVPARALSCPSSALHA